MTSKIQKNGLNEILNLLNFSQFQALIKFYDTFNICYLENNI